MDLIFKDKKNDVIYYKFLISYPININFKNINKKEFCSALSYIKNFKNNDATDIIKFFTYLDDQISYLPLIFF